ncbi:MAG TPA: ATP-dependent zinc metalloprotease FtsH, partial [Mycobacteriales bacterium]|nr:ATP-dependent zinc metalloprotease FtsH [Mycobacteriales bacterium]
MSSRRPGAPPTDKQPAPVGPPPPGWRRFLLPVGLALSAALLFLPRIGGPASTSLDYSTFLTKVDSGQVSKVGINALGAVTGTFTNGKTFTSGIPTAIAPSNLAAELRAHHVLITATATHSSVGSVLLGLLPLLLLIGFFVYTGLRARRQLSGALGGGGIMGFGRSRAKVIDVERPTTRFADVAGYEGAKQEINEVVDFLKSPQRYRDAGAVGPRGVLMVGAPGTGKTLLARAVAGEADVPFLAVTGSSFVEIFVGVGASRVRDLFADARKRGPSIIFIDEIDAIGQRRGTGLGGNDEREQTLNQLLAEMDGFDENHDVVVLAATNRPETLDPALLRPGRFDRQVTVPLPTQRERAAILAVHARNKNIGADASFDVVSRGTPGFSGADLANLLNEAAIVAVRDGRATISADDLADARDRLLIGRRDGSNVLLPEEKHAVAVHEAGHALVAALSEHADPVAKVTILPAGMALGVTEQLPLTERHLYSEGYLTDSLAVRLGGRAAELIVFGEGSTGASNDLAGATDLATRMVREFGLSPELGPV